MNINSQQNDEALFEKTIEVGQKRVFVDVKRNKQGVYLKLSEKGQNGNKNTVLIPATGLKKLRDVFDEALETIVLDPVSAQRRKRTSEAQTRSVYVSGLTWDTTWQELKDHMSMAGQVSNSIIMQTNGKSLGCGIIEYQNEEDVTNAVEQMNDTELKGRQIHVREDRPLGDDGVPVNNTTTKREKQNRIKNDENGNPLINDTKVFVTNLSWDTSAEDVKNHLEESGNILSVDILTSKNGRSLGCSLVEFETAEEAAHCIQKMKGTELDDRIIKLRPDYQMEDMDQN